MTLEHVNGGFQVTTVVTLMWGSAWERYGQNFVSTFQSLWPASVDLIIVSDVVPLPAVRAEFISTADIRGLQDFRDRHGGELVATGRGHAPGKGIEDGYNWKYDAVKWSWQAMAMDKAVENLPDGSIVAWLDADVITHQQVPDGLIEKILGDADICHLGRFPKHSEIGFYAARLNGLTRTFFAAFADLYRSDEIFKLKEWHSAFAFDACLPIVSGRGGKVKNLTPGGRGHVWFQAPYLPLYTDHLKGKRKALGRSRERG